MPIYNKLNEIIAGISIISLIQEMSGPTVSGAKVFHIQPEAADVSFQAILSKMVKIVGTN